MDSYNKFYSVIESSNLFDEDWFCDTYSIEDNVDPIDYYLKNCINLKLNPSPDFDTSWYLNNYADVKNSSWNPFVHYILFGKKEGRFPNALRFNSKNYSIIKNSNLFDEDWFFENYSLDESVNPIYFYLKNCIELGLNPNPYFDTLWYLNKYEDVKNSVLNPFIHYILFGKKEGRAPNKWEYYNDVQINKDDFSLNMEILSNSKFFDEKFYSDSYYDVKYSLFTPLEHYVKYGCDESSRSPNGDFSNLFYKNKYLINESENWNPLTHYEMIGQFKQYKTNMHYLSYSNYSLNQFRTILNIFESHVLIVISVFQSDFEKLEKCIEVIRNNTKLNYNIVLINHTSFEIKTDKFNNLITIEYDSKNFDSEIQEIIINSQEDIVFLCPYCKVTNGWLEKLVLKAYSDNKIDLVTPISNKLIGITEENFNFQDKTLTISGLSKLIERFNFEEEYEVPFFNGFCTYVKNESLKLLDLSKNSYFFNPKGYLSEKFIHNSLINVIDDNTYIHIDEDYYNSEFSLNDKFDIPENDFNETIKNKIIGSFSYMDNKILSNRVLIILNHENLKIANDLLIFFNKQNFDCYFLTVDSKIILFKSSYNSIDKLKEWGNDTKLTYLNILTSLKPDVIQIIGSNFNKELVDIVNLLKIPIIISLNLFGQKERLIHNSKDIFLISDRLTCPRSFENKYLSDGNVILIDDCENVYDFYSVLSKFEKKFKIFILDDVVSFSKKFNLNKLNNFFDFYYLDDFSKENSINQIIEDISPDIIGVVSLNSLIFDIIDISKEKSIPIFCKFDNALKNIFQDYDGVFFVEEYMLNLNLDYKLIYEKYYELLKEIYFNNKYFKEEISYLNRFFEDMYFELGDNSQKIFTNKFSIPLLNSNFSTLSDFLRESYTYPFFDVDIFQSNCYEQIEKLQYSLINNVENMEYKPLVSVIMPVYNRKYTVFYAIHSVLNQTYENFELIIIDDCSVDGTREELTKLNDERISVIFNDRNYGASESRNIGLKHANGEYISYLDSDNEWDSQYLESMIGALNVLCNADALYSGQVLYENQDSIPFAIRYAHFNKSLLKNRNYIDLNCFIHKSDIIDEIGGFDLRLKRLIDWDFILKINNYYNIYSVPIFLSKYYYFNTNNRISFLPINLPNIIKFTREKNILVEKIDSVQISQVNFLILNYTSINSFKSCLDSIFSLNLSNFKIILLQDLLNDSIKYYLSQINYPSIEIMQRISELGSYLDYYADLIILNDDVIPSGNLIKTMQNHSYSLKECGAVIPQRIASGNFVNISKQIPYADLNGECDISLSKGLKNVVDLPLFGDDNIFELNSINLFCAYIKNDVLTQIDFEEINDYNFILDYINNNLKLKLYHVSDCSVYLNKLP